MARVTGELKHIIAYNISVLRRKKYPGRGGGKLCAEAFGIPQQQWSPWESGSRTPDEKRISHIAEFFNVTVDDLHQEPENWAEIKPEWLAAHWKSKRRTKREEAEQPNNKDNVGKTESSGNSDDFVEIVKLLSLGASKVDIGELDPEDFADKMKQIRNYAKFIMG